MTPSFPAPRIVKAVSLARRNDTSNWKKSRKRGGKQQREYHMAISGIAC